MKIEPIYTNICNFNADWCLDQCYQIINTCPIFEKANNSGKFFRNYHTYRFYIDSEIPIIKKFIETLNNFSEILKNQALRYKNTPVMGRTHGVHAEITSLGLKFAL